MPMVLRMFVRGGMAAAASAAIALGAASACTAAECADADAPSRHRTGRTVLFLVSGKRCAGTGFVTEMAMRRLSADAVPVHRVAAGDICKRDYSAWAELDYERMLRDSAYEEEHREAMEAWRRRTERTEPLYFVEKTIRAVRRFRHEQLRSRGTPIACFICDTRRIAEVQAYRVLGGNMYGDPVRRRSPTSQAAVTGGRARWSSAARDARPPLDLDAYDAVVTVRVRCSDEVRLQRGWVPSSAEDDAGAEYELGDFAFDVVIDATAGDAETLCQIERALVPLVLTVSDCWDAARRPV